MYELMHQSLHKGIASLLTMNYSIVLWVMKVKLLHTAEYYKPQLLSSGGVITGVWLILCFYLTGFPLHFFSVHLWEKRTSLRGGWWCNLIWVGAMWSQNSLSGEEVKLLLCHWVQVICHSHLALWWLLGKDCSSSTDLTHSVILCVSAEKWQRSLYKLFGFIFRLKYLLFKTQNPILQIHRRRWVNQVANCFSACWHGDGEK